MSENIHEIEFRRSLCLALDGPRKRPHSLLQVAKGTRYVVRLVPYQKALREVADIHFPDGGVAREVSFNFFAFADAADDEPVDARD
jgi:hypothetical protein